MGGFEAMVTGESGNRATSQTQERLFEELIMPIRWTFEPIIRRIFSDYLKYKKIPYEKLPRIVWRDLTIETSNANRVALSRAVSAGWMTLNEARAVEGLPPLEKDYLYIPLNIAPQQPVVQALRAGEGGPTLSLEAISQAQTTSSTALLPARKLKPEEIEQFEKWAVDVGKFESLFASIVLKILADFETQTKKFLERLFK